ncbi:MAG: hypothetical protein KF791_10860 [Verrucomicrobiae bacterium]|nr:hypothetical protein [Verrucomicrobiae bacterium]
MHDGTELQESVPQDGASPASLVIRDVHRSTNGRIQLRRITGLGFVEWVEVLDDQNEVRLRPSDRIVLSGNARCAVYQMVNGAQQEAVAQVQSVRFRPERPVWSLDCAPDPSPVDERVVELQCPPVIDVHQFTAEGVAIQEIFVPGGMVQIEV